MKRDKEAFNTGLRRLIAVMLQEGFSQREIAKYFGITESMLHYYRSGKRNLSTGRQILIAEKIGLSYQDVIDFQ